jgi:hypothetical protein
MGTWCLQDETYAQITQAYIVTAVVRKELLRTLLAEVIVTVREPE